MSTGRQRKRAAPGPEAGPGDEDSSDGAAPGDSEGAREEADSEPGPCHSSHDNDPVVGMKRAFPSLTPSQDFYAAVPATTPGTSLERKATSDFFAASKSKYKSRIAKFVRATQQAGSEVKSTAIALEDASKLTHLRNKSRFSFKHDGIAAVGQVVDIFMESLMHEALRISWKRNAAKGLDADAVLELRDADLQQALEKLGWGPMSA